RRVPRDPVLRCMLRLLRVTTPASQLPGPPPPRAAHAITPRRPPRPGRRPTRDRRDRGAGPYHSSPPRPHDREVTGDGEPRPLSSRDHRHRPGRLLVRRSPGGDAGADPVEPRRLLRRAPEDPARDRQRPRPRAARSLRRAVGRPPRGPLP